MTTKKIKFVPDDHDLAVAANAKRIFNEEKKKRGFSQEKAGEEMGFSQSAVTQYLNAKIPFNLPAKIRFSEYLNCSITDIDPDVESAVSLSVEERLIIENYRKSQDAGKEFLRNSAETALKISTPSP